MFRSISVGRKRWSRFGYFVGLIFVCILNVLWENSSKVVDEITSRDARGSRSGFKILIDFERRVTCRNAICSRLT